MEPLLSFSLTSKVSSLKSEGLPGITITYANITKFSDNAGALTSKTTSIWGERHWKEIERGNKERGCYATEESWTL